MFWSRKTNSKRLSCGIETNSSSSARRRCDARWSGRAPIHLCTIPCRFWTRAPLWFVGLLLETANYSLLLFWTSSCHRSTQWSNRVTTLPGSLNVFLFLRSSRSFYPSMSSCLWQAKILRRKKMSHPSTIRWRPSSRESSSGTRLPWRWFKLTTQPSWSSQAWAGNPRAKSRREAPAWNSAEATLCSVSTRSLSSLKLWRVWVVSLKLKFECCVWS